MFDSNNNTPGSHSWYLQVAFENVCKMFIKELNKKKLTAGVSEPCTVGGSIG